MSEEKQLKDTLNLPSTTLAMRANAAVREVEIQKYWEENKIYEKAHRARIYEADSRGKRYLP